MPAVLLLLGLAAFQAQPPRPTPFTTPLTAAEMKGKPSAIETTVEVVRARVTRVGP